MRSTRRIAAAAGLLLAAGASLVALPGAAQDPSLRERILEIRREAANAPPRQYADPKAPIAKPGDYTFQIQHDGIDRTYRIHVPSRYDASRPTPLLVSLHGGGATMDYQASDENYGQISKSDQAGFIVAFPNGYSRLPGGKLATWNGGNCCGPARDRNVDDVGFIRAMVDNLGRQLNIDRKRIYATGMSNGGIMAQRLACDAADMFRAIAPVAGTDNTKSCNPSQPVSVLQIHAKDDDHLPFNGGMGAKSMGRQVTSFTSVPESISRWVKRDACNATPKRVLDKPGAHCERYDGCRGDTHVELCVTDTGAHSWPGAAKWRGDEPPSKAISANDVMWDFFEGLDR